MGTSAQITIKGTGINVYKHYDGYINYTGELLKERFKDFYKKRGNDKEYAVANIIKALTPGESDVKDINGLGISTEEFSVNYYYTIDLEEGVIIVDDEYIHDKHLAVIDLKEE